MTTLSKEFLSASTNGRPVKVVATVAGSATTVHTAPANTTGKDVVYLWAWNSSASDVKLTVCWGGTTDPDDLVEITLPAEGGPVLVVDGWPLNNGLIVKAFAGSANVVMVGGYVNRMAA
jgi:hypothetical protein